MTRHALLSLVALALMSKAGVAEGQENCNTALTRIARKAAERAIADHRDNACDHIRVFDAWMRTRRKQAFDPLVVAATGNESDRPNFVVEKASPSEAEGVAARSGREAGRVELTHSTPPLFRRTFSPSPAMRRSTAAARQTQARDIETWLVR